jgi:hypothetical protein
VRERGEGVNEPVIHQQATSYTVAVVPLEDLEGRRRGLSTWDVEVEWTGVPGKWAVRHLGRVYDINGEEVWEPSPSNREDDFLERTRFDLETALKIARRVAPAVVVNGLTAVEAYERYGSKPKVEET